MTRIRNFIYNLAILASLVLAAPTVAQQELITVTLQPDNTDWQWQSYAESITSLFANSISSRVSQGIESREFVADTAAAVLSFNIRVGSSGELLNFTPLTPLNRYHAYLIRRTAMRVQPFRPTPRELPVFYFDGVITFECRFQPTRWYKKLYFDQPLDSLKLPLFAPQIKAAVITDPVMPTYEPIVKDKQQLLVEFKQRIGVTEEIADTSSYSPLDVAGRVFFVHVPYDSLGLEPMSDLLLQSRLERALKQAGAKITNQDYDPLEALAAAERAAAVADSMAALADSLAALDSTETEADSIETPAEDESLRGIPPGRNLAEAFASVFDNEFLVLSAALAQDSTGDSALCRVKLYPSEHPGQLKRNLSYKFNAGSRLPDSLGIKLVQRLTAPPAKPAPPPKPKPKIAAKPADTTSVEDTTAVADTTAATADTTAAALDTTAATSLQQQPAEGADSSAAGATTVADSATATPAASDTSAAPEQENVPGQDETPAKIPAKKPAADSTAPAQESPPAETGTTAADTP